MDGGWWCAGKRQIAGEWIAWSSLEGTRGNDEFPEEVQRLSFSWREPLRLP